MTSTQSSAPASQPLVLGGTAHPRLARDLAEALGCRLVPSPIERFPDGEISVHLGEPVHGADVIVVQPTAAPVGENLLELLLVGDALWRAGATTTTAVIPYFGYARHERRKGTGEALGARVVSDVLATGHFTTLLALDLHAAALEGFVSMPLVHATATPSLAKAVGEGLPDDVVLVAPDLGAAKLVRAYARRLDRPVALVRKARKSGTEVEVEDVVGDVRGKRLVVVDDMISTGGTLVAALGALYARGARRGATVVATHGLFVGEALGRLAASGVEHIVTTDSVPVIPGGETRRTVVPVAPLLADVLGRWRSGASLADVVPET